jgi:hypothetical protein
MAVVQVVTSQVKPDKLEEFLELNRKAGPILEKAGGKNIRLMAALVAGEATGSFVGTVEADDFAAYGAVLDNFFADPEGQGLMATLGSSASPIASYQMTVWVDVPL